MKTFHNLPSNAHQGMFKISTHELLPNFYRLHKLPSSLLFYKFIMLAYRITFAQQRKVYHFLFIHKTNGKFQIKNILDYGPLYIVFQILVTYFSLKTINWKAKYPYSGIVIQGIF